MSLMQKWKYFFDWNKIRRRRPFPIFYIFLISILIGNANVCKAEIEEVFEAGTYVGCFHERIDLYKALISAGNVQVCLEMCENFYYRYAVLSLNDKCSCANDLSGGRIEDSICNARCTKNKSYYCGGVDAQSYYDTGVIASGPPMNLHVINISDTSITLQWDDPQKPDIVTSFIIKTTVIHTFSSDPISTNTEWVIQSTDRQFELSNLHPATEYNITVFSMCDKRNCGSAFIINETLIGYPDPIPQEPKVIKDSDTTITVDLVPAINNNGPITYYRVIVMFIDNEIFQPFDEEFLADYNHSIESGTPYYIAAEINYQNVTRRFIVGDKRSYRGYYNAPLPTDRHVHICLGIISQRKGITLARYAITTHDQHYRGKAFLDIEDGQSSVLALSSACIIFGLLLIGSIFAYCYLRLKAGNRRQRLSDTHELTPQGPMVEVENNGFVADEFVKTSFRTQLNNLVENLDQSQRFARNAIRLNIDEIIAQGNYGEVLPGKLYVNTAEVIDCQTHVISDDMDSQDQASFLRDLEEIIRLMPHEKFLQFYGISASPDWFYVIFEREEVTLKNKLIEARVPPNIDNYRFSSISEECVLQWVYDISTAMEYLEVNKIIHKKLCSYNVYVTSSNEIKVSLFGPTPFEDQISRRQIDISRWMAPEVLRFQHHSIKSDVWSFGCLAWECCTLGATLYANITNADLIPRIKNGVRPEQPSFIYNDLYQLLLNCWQTELSERPDFEEIAFNVRHLLTSPRHALSFDRHENLFIPYYLPLLEIQN